LDFTGGTPPYQYNWQNLVGPSVGGLTAVTYPLQIVGANYCELNTSIIVNSQLSVDENESEFTITYNQINNSVVVANWAGDSEVVSLYDLSGKQLMIFNLNQPYQEFKLSNSLAPGVYLFGNENQSIKILVNQ